LTDRLSRIDLLARGTLLIIRSKSAWKGVARASIAPTGEDLPSGHKPKEALATINDTRQTGFRTISTSSAAFSKRALAVWKQSTPAIDLIADDDMPQAKRLRADMAWDSGNWTSAGARRRTWSRPLECKRALNDEERAQVMRAAVAIRWAMTRQRSIHFAEHYAAKMNASPMQGVRHRTIAPTVRARVPRPRQARFRRPVDTLQAFMRI